MKLEKTLMSTTFNRSCGDIDEENLLVERILEKQGRKIELDQDIETVEDDLF